MHTDTTILMDTDTEHMALSLQDELALTNDRLVLLEFSIGLVDWRDMNVSRGCSGWSFECLIFGLLYMLICHLRF